MTSFWRNDNIVWEEGIKEMHLAMKDDRGGSDHAHKRPEVFPNQDADHHDPRGEVFHLRPETRAEPA